MKRLLTPGWLAAHVLTAALSGGMLWLAGWQLSRGLEGNSISWGYALQWPAFAGFVVFVWAREVRRARRTPHESPAGLPASVTAAADDHTGSGVHGTGSPVRGPEASGRPVISRQPVVSRRVALGRAGPGPAEPADTDDPELSAYNRYLAWLNTHPDARPADYPG